jgi:hypothetical protein
MLGGLNYFSSEGAHLWLEPLVTFNTTISESYRHLRVDVLDLYSLELIPLSSIVIVGVNNQLLREERTDDDGSFLFRDIPQPALYTLNVTHPLYEGTII